MKKYFQLSLYLLAIVSLTGCAFLRIKSIANTQFEITPKQWIALPTPAQLDFNIKATQILTAKYKIKDKDFVYTSQIQVEKTSKYLILVAIAGWGGEIFSINYDGFSVKTSSLPLPNSEVGIQHTLMDFILTYANPSLLREMLKSTNIKLVLKPNQRIFMFQNKPFIKINYQCTDPWQGNVLLQNFKHHYTIKISTVSYTR